MKHKYFFKVKPYKSVQDAYSWLILWRVTASFSSLLAFGFISLSLQLVSLLKTCLKLLFFLKSIFCYN